MAPPKKWDDEESSSEESSDESVSNQAQPVRKKFDDEEDESDVASNWDEADDSEEERKKASAAAAAKAKSDALAAANKKSKAQRIEEHREANRAKKLADQLDADSDEDEDDADRRARLRQSEQDSDLKHAEDLFGAAQGPTTRIKPVVIKDAGSDTGTVDLAKIPLFKPGTKTQFDALSEVLVPLLRASSAKPHYPLWLGGFCKQISQDLPSAEIKKVASALTALGNEKMKEEKDKDKSGKKTKAAKTKVSAVMGRDAGRGGVDTESYADDGLGDDDFM